MTCETCDGDHELLDVREHVMSCPGPTNDHITYVKAEMVDCPDCKRCEDCHTGVWELEAVGEKHLTDYQEVYAWCGPKCLASWLSCQTWLTPVKKLEFIMVARDIYLNDCGCNFPDGSHSNGCHKIVDELNEMAEIATEGAG